MLAQTIIETVAGYVPLEDFADSESLNDANDDIATVSNTVKALRAVCNSEAQQRLKLDVSSFTLILDSSLESSSRVGDEDSALRLVKEIAEAARAVAPTHACSSVLAGHASESDDYADIGLLMSTNSVNINPTEKNLEKSARNVLSGLGLDTLLASQIHPLSISKETIVPVAFRASADDADVQRLKSLLGKLSHRFAFSVAAEDVVFHFLLGQVPDGGVWAGLLGVGTWSD